MTEKKKRRRRAKRKSEMENMKERGTEQNPEREGREVQERKKWQERQRKKRQIKIERGEADRYGWMTIHEHYDACHLTCHIAKFFPKVFAPKEMREVSNSLRTLSIP